MRACLSASEVLALKHESRILRQRSNPVSGSRKSQNQFSMGHTAQSLTRSIMQKHIQGGMNVRESYSPALEQGTLVCVRREIIEGGELLRTTTVGYSRVDYSVNRVDMEQRSERATLAWPVQPIVQPIVPFPVQYPPYPHCSPIPPIVCDTET